MSPPLGYVRSAYGVKSILQAGWAWRQGRRSDALEIVRNHLGNLKGPLLKLGQLAALVPGLLPLEYEEILQTLQAQAPPLAWPVVQRQLEAELGLQWPQNFDFFSQIPEGAASLGQIHRARLASGERVACKIQYPGMASILHQDLRFFRALCWIYTKMGGGVDPSLLLEEVGARLWEEIDFWQEGIHLKWFQYLLEAEPDIRTPIHFPKVSTSKVLTMTWMEGCPLQEALHHPQSMKDALGRRIFTAWYRPFSQAGILHGDAHGGNMTWTSDHLNMLDFGCVRVFSPQFVGGVFQLFRALQSGKEEHVVDACASLGLIHLDRPILGIIVQWARFLLGPFLTDRITTLGEHASGSQGKALLFQLHQALSQKGGVRLPAEFLLLDRVAVGVGSALVRLGARQNWHRLFQTLADTFSEEGCKQTQTLLFSSAQHRT